MRSSTLRIVPPFRSRAFVCAWTFAIANMTAQLVLAETGVTNITDGSTQGATDYILGNSGPFNARIITNAGRWSALGL